MFFSVYSATSATIVSFSHQQVMLFPFVLFHCCATFVLGCPLPLLSLLLYYWLPFSSLVDCFCLISWHRTTHGFCYWLYNLKTPSYGIHSVGLLDWPWCQLQMHYLMHSVQFSILQLWNPSHLLLNFIETIFTNKYYLLELPLTILENIILNFVILYLNLSNGIKWFYWGKKQNKTLL